MQLLLNQMNLFITKHIWFNVHVYNFIGDYFFNNDEIL